MMRQDIKVGSELVCVSDDHIFVKKGQIVVVKDIYHRSYQGEPTVGFEGMDSRSYISNVERCFKSLTTTSKET